MIPFDSDVEIAHLIAIFYFIMKQATFILQFDKRMNISESTTPAVLRGGHRMKVGF